MCLDEKKNSATIDNFISFVAFLVPFIPFLCALFVLFHFGNPFSHALQENKRLFVAIPSVGLPDACTCCPTGISVYLFVLEELYCYTSSQALQRPLGSYLAFEREI